MERRRRRARSCGVGRVGRSGVGCVSKGGIRAFQAQHACIPLQEGKGFVMGLRIRSGESNVEGQRGGGAGVVGRWEAVTADIGSKWGRCRRV